MYRTLCILNFSRSFAQINFGVVCEFSLHLDLVAFWQFVPGLSDIAAYVVADFSSTLYLLSESRLPVSLQASSCSKFYIHNLPSRYVSSPRFELNWKLRSPGGNAHQRSTVVCICANFVIIPVRNIVLPSQIQNVFMLASIPLSHSHSLSSIPGQELFPISWKREFISKCISREAHVSIALTRFCLVCCLLCNFLESLFTIVIPLLSFYCSWLLVFVNPSESGKFGSGSLLDNVTLYTWGWDELALPWPELRRIGLQFAE